MTILHDCGGVLGWPLDTFFGLSQFHGHGSWLVCEMPLANCRSSILTHFSIYSNVNCCAGFVGEIKWFV